MSLFYQGWAPLLVILYRAISLETICTHTSKWVQKVAFIYFCTHTLAYNNNSQRKRGLELESQRLAWEELAGTWERPEGRNEGMGVDVILFQLKYIQKNKVEEKVEYCN